MKALQLLAFVAIVFASTSVNAQRVGPYRPDSLVTVSSGMIRDDMQYEIRVPEALYKSGMTNMLDLNWFDEIWAESVTVDFDYDYGMSVYNLYVSKVDVMPNPDVITVLWGLTQYGVTGSGTEQIDITGLTMGTGWNGLLQVVDNDGDVVEELEIWPITQIEPAILSISDMPIFNGIQTGFTVTVSEYGEGYPNKIQKLYFQRTDLDNGDVDVDAMIIMGVGNLTQETFYKVYDQTHTYEICAWFTYEDGGLAPLWGPEEIKSTCDDPIVYPGLITGVGEAIEEPELLVFPNPASMEITINGFTAGEMIDIIDGGGRLIRSIPFSTAMVHQVSDLDAGVYMIRGQRRGWAVRFMKL